MPRYMIIGSVKVHDVTGSEQPQPASAIVDAAPRFNTGALACWRSDETASYGLGPCTHSVPNAEHDDRADDCNEQRPDTKAAIPVGINQEAPEKATNQRADDAGDDVLQPVHLAVSAHDHARDPARERPDNQPADDTHNSLSFLTLDENANARQQETAPAP